MARLHLRSTNNRTSEVTLHVEVRFLMVVLIFKYLIYTISNLTAMTKCCENLTEEKDGGLIH